MIVLRLSATCRFICQAGLAAGLGRGGDLQQLLVLLAMLGQELGGGDEHRAGQAGVGVRAALLDRQAAVAVGQRLGRPAEPLLGPGRFGERPAGVQGDGLALGVDLAGLFPVAAHGLIVQPSVMAVMACESWSRIRRTTSCGTSWLSSRVPRVWRH
jgi:hypothetical protein